MAAVDTTALELLGKNISFLFHRSVPEQYVSFFPQPEQLTGQVKAVLISVDGNHEILVDEEFYSFSEITLI